jgi:hypothetical protein
VKKPEPTPPGCKVITQYRSAGEMVYEVECSGISLDIRVSSQPGTAGERDWHVAAQSGRDADAIVITESAPTKAEALRKVAASWEERAPDLGLPLFNWEAVAVALLAVRGI